MALGRRKSKQRSTSSVDPYATIGQPEHHTAPAPTEVDEVQELGTGAGPYDLGTLESTDGLDEGRLDLGSIILAMPPESQLQVEMSPEGVPVGVHLDTPVGRITPGVFAAPKSGGQWREVVTELADSLRENGAQVSIEDGHWGREYESSLVAGQTMSEEPKGCRQCRNSIHPKPRTPVFATLFEILLSGPARRGGDVVLPRRRNQR